MPEPSAQEEYNAIHAAGERSLRDVVTGLR